MFFASYMLFEFTNGIFNKGTAYDYTDREETFFSSKDKTPKPKGLPVFQVVTIILCIFLSVVIYGTFNIESIP